MSNMQERLEATVVQAEIDVNKFHQIVHGDTETIVETENGALSSLSKQMKDVRDEITGGVSDIVAEAEKARDEAIRVKDESLETEIRINENKKVVEELKSETSDIKDQAQEIYNQIESTTLSSLDNIDKETEKQISNINDVTQTNLENINVESSKQIELAKEQANLAIQAAQTTLYSVIELYYIQTY